MRVIFFLILSCFFSAPLYADNAIWLLVDTKNLSLSVKRGDQVLQVYNNIAIGRGGAGNKEKVGDDVTPLGTYKIGWINKNSPYHIFYGFDYPSTRAAEKAYSEDRIDKKTYLAIAGAHENNRIPPQYTPLGGQIGIHGLGRGDVSIHSMANWTHGCVAMTNTQIDSLGKWIGKGTKVVIR